MNSRSISTVLNACLTIFAGACFYMGHIEWGMICMLFAIKFQLYAMEAK